MRALLSDPDYVPPSETGSISACTPRVDTSPSFTSLKTFNGSTLASNTHFNTHTTHTNMSGANAAAGFAFAPTIDLTPAFAATPLHTQSLHAQHYAPASFASPFSSPALASTVDNYSTVSATATGAASAATVSAASVSAASVATAPAATVGGSSQSTDDSRLDSGSAERTVTALQARRVELLAQLSQLTQSQLSQSQLTLSQPPPQQPHPSQPTQTQSPYAGPVPAAAVTASTHNVTSPAVAASSALTGAAAAATGLHALRSLHSDSPTLAAATAATAASVQQAVADASRVLLQSSQNLNLTQQHPSKLVDASTSSTPAFGPTFAPTGFASVAATVATAAATVGAATSPAFVSVSQQSPPSSPLPLPLPSHAPQSTLQTHAFDGTAQPQPQPLSSRLSRGAIGSVSAPSAHGGGGFMTRTPPPQRATASTLATSANSAHMLRADLSAADTGAHNRLDTRSGGVATRGASPAVSHQSAFTAVSTHGAAKSHVQSQTSGQVGGGMAMMRTPPSRFPMSASGDYTRNGIVNSSAFATAAPTLANTVSNTLTASNAAAATDSAVAAVNNNNTSSSGAHHRRGVSTDRAQFGRYSNELMSPLALPPRPRSTGPPAAAAAHSRLTPAHSHYDGELATQSLSARGHVRARAGTDSTAVAHAVTAGVGAGATSARGHSSRARDGRYRESTPPQSRSPSRARSRSRSQARSRSQSRSHTHSQTQTYALTHAPTHAPTHAQTHAQAQVHSRSQTQTRSRPQSASRSQRGTTPPSQQQQQYMGRESFVTQLPATAVEAKSPESTLPLKRQSLGTRSRWQRHPGPLALPFPYPRPTSLPTSAVASATASPAPFAAFSPQRAPSRGSSSQFDSPTVIVGAASGAGAVASGRGGVRVVSGTGGTYISPQHLHGSIAMSPGFVSPTHSRMRGGGGSSSQQQQRRRSSSIGRGGTPTVGVAAAAATAAAIAAAAAADAAAAARANVQAEQASYSIVSKTNTSVHAGAAAALVPAVANDASARARVPPSVAMTLTFASPKVKKPHAFEAKPRTSEAEAKPSAEVKPQVKAGRSPALASIPVPSTVAVKSNSDKSKTDRGRSERDRSRVRAVIAASLSHTTNSPALVTTSATNTKSSAQVKSSALASAVGSAPADSRKSDREHRSRSRSRALSQPLVQPAPTPTAAANVGAAVSAAGASTSKRASSKSRPITALELTQQLSVSFATATPRLAAYADRGTTTHAVAVNDADVLNESIAVNDSEFDTTAGNFDRVRGRDYERARERQRRREHMSSRSRSHSRHHEKNDDEENDMRHARSRDQGHDRDREQRKSDRARRHTDRDRDQADGGKGDDSDRDRRRRRHKERSLSRSHARTLDNTVHTATTSMDTLANVSFYPAVNHTNAHVTVAAAGAKATPIFSVQDSLALDDNAFLAALERSVYGAPSDSAHKTNTVFAGESAASRATHNNVTHARAVNPLSPNSHVAVAVAHTSSANRARTAVTPVRTAPVSASVSAPRASAASASAMKNPAATATAAHSTRSGGLFDNDTDLLALEAVLIGPFNATTTANRSPLQSTFVIPISAPVSTPHTNSQSTQDEARIPLGALPESAVSNHVQSFAPISQSQTPQMTQVQTPPQTAVRPQSHSHSQSQAHAQARAVEAAVRAALAAESGPAANASHDASAAERADALIARVLAVCLPNAYIQPSCDANVSALGNFSTLNANASVANNVNVSSMYQQQNASINATLRSGLDGTLSTSSAFGAPVPAPLPRGSRGGKDVTVSSPPRGVIPLGDHGDAGDDNASADEDNVYSATCAAPVSARSVRSVGGVLRGVSAAFQLGGDPVYQTEQAQKPAVVSDMGTWSVPPSNAIKLHTDISASHLDHSSAAAANMSRRGQWGTGDDTLVNLSGLDALSAIRMARDRERERDRRRAQQGDESAFQSDSE